MHALTSAKQQILLDLKLAIGKEYAPTTDELSNPPDAAMGDLSFGCFRLAKEQGRSPVEIATEIAAHVAPRGVIKEVKSAGPYVNFFLDASAYGTAVLEEIESEKASYGTSKTGSDVTVMVEYANLNTHKDVHVGHLRNLFVGHAIVNILKAVGYRVVPAYYLNDLGAHVALCLWGIKNSGPIPKLSKGEYMPYLNRMYANGVAQAKENAEVKAEVAKIHRDLEEHKGPYLALWKKTRRWSIAHLEGIYKELGLPIERKYFESELIGDTKRIIEEWIKKGLIIHSEGAWIVDLAAEGFGVNLLVKSDGTLLYNAKDLALAMKKEADVSPQRSVIVVDARQKLVMNQLFATLKRMGHSKEYSQIVYDHVELKSGPISSRTGQAPRYEDLLNEMRKAANEEALSRHADWPEKERSRVAESVTKAAFRFSYLDHDLQKKMILDPEQALALEGRSGPYLLYTFVRIQSLLKKAGRKGRGEGAVKFDLPEEKALLMKLSQFPEAVSVAASQMSPTQIVAYAYELSQSYAKFYEKAGILNAEDGQVRASRLRLSKAVAVVLESALLLLGIRPVQKM